MVETNHGCVRLLTVIQTGGPSLMQQLDTKCKLSQRAQLLLAVSDQAAAASNDDSKEGGPAAVAATVHKIRHTNHHKQQHQQGKHEDAAQHWLLG